MPSEITKILLRKNSSFEYEFCVDDVPTGTTVDQAFFMIKADDDDADEDAIISKTIGVGENPDGQITDTGASGQADLIFIVSADDADLLTVGQLYISGVKVRLDNLMYYEPPYSRRPVRVLNSVIGITTS